MKSRFNRYVVLGMIGIAGMMLAGGCAPVRVTQQYQKFNRIYVGWMDLGEKNYAAYGYGTKSEWEQEIKTQNIDSLQAYTFVNLLLPFLNKLLQLLRHQYSR